MTGASLTTKRPLIIANKPIKDPIEISILPVIMTIDMPMAATAI